MTACSKCKGEFPRTAEYFGLDNQRKDGLSSQCRACRRATAKTSYSRLVFDATTNKATKVSTLNSRKLRATEERRTKANVAAALSNRNRYKNGKFQEYLASNPLAKLRLQISRLIRNSIGRKGWSKNTKTAQLLRCSFQDFKSHIESQFTEGMSWENQGAWHYDHILPCACAENEDELNALQHWSNFQPMWGSENLSKGESLSPDWRERKQKLMEIYWSSRSVAN